MKNAKIAGSVVLLALLTACSGEEAAKQLLPRGCVPEDFRFSGNQLILLDTPDTNKGQRLYGIKNLTLQNIGVDHVKAEAGAGAGWGSELAPNHWSALAINRPDFSIVCHDLDKETAVEINCQDVLLVCRFAKADFPSTATSSGWVSENQPMAKLLDAIEERGIKLSSDSK